MQEIDFIFGIAILIMSVVIHEVSHGQIAYYLGDSTAKWSGRLTLNPINHLDIFGSIILPLLLFLSGTGFIVGWAKPVPYNPYNLKSQKWGPALVALAGPASNILLALIFGFIVRISGILPDFILPAFFNISLSIIIINLMLAVFNLVPIPPLDGSKILFSILPFRSRHIQEFLEQWGFIILIFFIIFLFNKISPIIYILFRLITGLNI